MPKTATEQKQDRDRALEPEHDRGLVVILWLLALLIAEIEFWTWAFTHMARP